MQQDQELAETLLSQIPCNTITCYKYIPTYNAITNMYIHLYRYANTSFMRVNISVSSISFKKKSFRDLLHDHHYLPCYVL